MKTIHLHEKDEQENGNDRINDHTDGIASDDTDPASGVNPEEESATEGEAVPSLGKKREEPLPKGRLPEEEDIKLRKYTQERTLTVYTLKRCIYLRKRLKSYRI